MQNFDDFMQIVREIREKCPWDSAQTHESLKQYLLEESNEVIAGIDRLNQEGDAANLCEELGDVLFQIALHSLIAEEEGFFTIEDVIQGVSDKMKFRHPKIFVPEDRTLLDLSWKELKEREKALAKTRDIQGKKP